MSQVQTLLDPPNMKDLMEIQTDDMVLFWQRDSIFSNWYEPVTIKYKDFEFKNSEALFMYFKAEAFGDEDIQKEILSNQKPSAAKAAGRRVENYNDEAWAKCRSNYMTIALSMKFNQNPELKEKLLETGDKTLVEASPYDTIWGIGLKPTDPNAKDVSKWRGKNLLGKALMDLRAVYKKINDPGLSDLPV